MGFNRESAAETAREFDRALVEKMRAIQSELDTLFGDVISVSDMTLNAEGAPSETDDAQYHLAQYFGYLRDAVDSVRVHAERAQAAQERQLQYLKSDAHYTARGTAVEE